MNFDEPRPDPEEPDLDELDGPPDDTEVVRSEWQAELARRVEDIRSGRVQLVDGRIMLEEIRERLRKKRGE
jgi:putative addiction module component (TIGR02574 family)